MNHRSLHGRPTGEPGGAPAHWILSQSPFRPRVQPSSDSARSIAELVHATLRPRPGDDRVRYSTLFAIRTLARRVVYLRDEVDELTTLLKPLIDQTAPGLLGVHGVGYEVAAKLLIAAGDNPQRLTSERAFAHMCGVAPLPASSGKTQRHRLNRGGHRQANNALYRIVITRMSSDQRTRDYVARRRVEGKSTGEIVRILKRYVAREVFKHLQPITS